MDDDEVRQLTLDRAQAIVQALKRGLVTLDELD